MAKMTYGEQLKHPNWQKKRLEVLEAAGWACTLCGCKELTLHVHHRRYVKGRMAWDYSAAELMSLCESCHGELHEQDELFERVFTTFDQQNGGAGCGKGMAAALLAAYACVIGSFNDDLAEEMADKHPTVFAAGILAAALGRNRMLEATDAADIKAKETNEWLKRGMGIARSLTRFGPKTEA